MSTISQGEAVRQAVRAVFVEGKVPETTTWTKEQKEKVHSTVFAFFKTGACVKNSGGTDDASLLKYIPGLVNNWVRKDTSLNGGTTYVPKNPGSRSGSGDESIKAMRTLLSITTDPDARKAIEEEIAKRTAELKPKVTLDPEKLPESLRHLVPAK